MRDIFFFDRMIVPQVITVIYWLLLAAAVISGLGIMFGGGTGGGSFLGGLVTIVLGALGARIWCEIVIVIFKINESLQAIKDK